MILRIVKSPPCPTSSQSRGRVGVGGGGLIDRCRDKAPTSQLLLPPTHHYNPLHQTHPPTTRPLTCRSISAPLLKYLLMGMSLSILTLLPWSLSFLTLAAGSSTNALLTTVPCLLMTAGMSLEKLTNSDCRSWNLYNSRSKVTLSARTCAFESRP